MSYPRKLSFSKPHKKYDSYREAYETIREITGIGEGKGFYISYHDGFSGLSNFAGFLRGADRIAMDSHPYMAFDGSSATDPMDTGVGEGAGGVWPGQACSRWSSMMDNRCVIFLPLFFPVSNPR